MELFFNIYMRANTAAEVFLAGCNFHRKHLNTIFSCSVFGFCCLFCYCLDMATLCSNYLCDESKNIFFIIRLFLV